MKKLGQTAVALVALTSMAVAAAEPSIQRGKELFESKQLGTSGKSCADCHPAGKKLEQAASYDEKELGEMVNRCIAGPLKGKAPGSGSADTKSLILYIRTFAKP